VIYRNCDILCFRHQALGVHVVDSATISDITFDNIRIEDAGNATRRWKHTATLIRLGITKDMWGTDPETGHISGVRIHNVSLQGKTALPSEVLGHDAKSQVEKIAIINLNYLGKIAMSAADANMKTNAFIGDLQFSRE
jgi:hypothetical protein